MLFFTEFQRIRSLIKIKPEQGKGRFRALTHNLLMQCQHLPLEHELKPGSSQDKNKYKRKRKKQRLLRTQWRSMIWQVLPIPLHWTSAAKQEMVYTFKPKPTKSTQTFNLNISNHLSIRGLKLCFWLKIVMLVSAKHCTLTIINIYVFKFIFCTKMCLNYMFIVFDIPYEWYC